MGPIDYSTNYPSGLLIDGFKAPPTVMMNHHPEYYQRLLSGCGLIKAKDLHAWWFDGQNKIDAHWRKRINRLANRYRVRVGGRRHKTYRIYRKDLAASCMSPSR